ncbi:MAG: hypothetical protein V3R92_02475 [Dehalococcoidales bacterium]
MLAQERVRVLARVRGRVPELAPVLAREWNRRQRDFPPVVLRKKHIIT